VLTLALSTRQRLALGSGGLGVSGCEIVVAMA
jgi:hypothetical protein